VRARPQCAIDGHQHAFKVLHHLIVPESQHTIASALQHGVAPLIARLRLLGMLAAIELDNQGAFKADEVDDIGVDRPLPPDLKDSKRRPRRCRHKRSSASVAFFRKSRARV
jgi:hypothetical protein